MNNHSKQYRLRLIAGLLCAVLLARSTLALSEHPHATAVPPPSPPVGFSNFNLGFNFGKEIAWTAVGLGAVIGVGLYLLLRKGPGITGCVATNTDGLQMTDEADRRLYTLSGKTVLLKPGERVRVYGKKRKGSGAARLFIVKRRPRAMGACVATH